jgi:hypothetical protein
MGWYVMAFMVLLTVTLSIPAVSSGLSPHVFIGTARVDGNAVPEGTRITAVVGGEEKGSSQVYDPGKYGPLEVHKPTSGSLVTFRVGTRTAEQAVHWEQGGSTELDLTVEGDRSSIKSTQRWFQPNP